jgi:hypothetical protein
MWVDGFFFRFLLIISWNEIGFFPTHFRLNLFDARLKVVDIDFGLLKRATSKAMRKCKFGCKSDIEVGDFISTFEGGMCAG